MPGDVNFGAVRESWPVVTDPVALGAADAHVWMAWLDAPEEVLQQWQQVISTEERERMNRFLRPEDRRRFLAAHAILRLLLARYVQVPPEELRFGKDTFGKPHLLGQSRTVSFNLSHSAEMALFGFARDRRIGVDVEQIRPGNGLEEVADRFFAPGEIATLRSLPAEHRTDAFFNCWTRKEAYLKARGCGLSGGLADFEVSLRPDEPAILRASVDPQDSVPWSLVHLTPGTGYVGAAVVEGREAKVLCQSWGCNFGAGTG